MNKEDAEFFNKVNLGERAILKRTYGNRKITITKLTDGYDFQGSLIYLKHLLEIGQGISGIGQKYKGSKLEDYVKDFLKQINRTNKENMEF